MRNWWIFTLLFCLTSCQPAEEPSEPAPAPAAEEVSLNSADVESDITTVEFENDVVRVIRTRRPPGHPPTQHTHGKGVFIALTDSKNRVTSENGDVNEFEGKAGDIGNTFDGVEPHATENVGDSTSEGVMVELKVDSGTPVEAPSHDAVEVDGDHHTVEFENDLVRVVRMTYPEGHVTPPHNHYSGVNIWVTDARTASGPEGGEAGEPADRAKGDVAWADAGEPHVTNNLGGEMQIVRVELKIE